MAWAAIKSRQENFVNYRITASMTIAVCRCACFAALCVDVCDSLRCVADCLQTSICDVPFDVQNIQH